MPWTHLCQSPDLGEEGNEVSFARPLARNLIDCLSSIAKTPLLAHFGAAITGLGEIDYPVSITSLTRTHSICPSI